MNRIKHKIAAALALFGVVMAPAALAQHSASGTASLEVMVPIDFIRAIRGLQLGQAFPPPSGTAIFGLTCGGSDGAFTLGDADSLAVGGTRACGRMDVTVGIADANFRLQFREAGTRDIEDAGSDSLATEYRPLRRQRRQDSGAFCR